MRAAGYVRVRVDGQTYSVDQPPQIDRRRKHHVEVVIDRVTIRPDARSPIAGSVETPWRWAAACCTWSIPRDDVPEPQLAGGNAQPAFCLRPLRAELRAALAAQFLVQQSPWAGARPAKGWACRPARIRRPCSAIRSSRWPRARWRCGPAPRSRLFARMLEAFLPRHRHSDRRAVRRSSAASTAG